MSRKSLLNGFNNTWLVSLFVVAGLLLALPTNVTGAESAGDDEDFYEEDRVAEFDKRYSRQWPPKPYIPNTEGWKRLYERRFRQIREIDGDQHLDMKYEGWMQNVFPAFLVQNFTELGFGLVRAPDDLLEALQKGIHDGLENGEASEEEDVGVIEGPNCLFIDRPDLTQRTLTELQGHTESWAGRELVPAFAYGFRLYQNNSVLNMHVDKKQSHIISMILHIDSSDDAEPWPIFIEDFHGRTHEVILTPGDILFYESSKCLHGRPKKFNGSWYTSIFIHYHPVDWQKENHRMRTHYVIPPDWNDAVEEKTETPIQFIRTSFKEPECPNGWCATQNAIKWSGPGQDGYWIDPNGNKHPFHPERHTTRSDGEL